MKKPDSGVQDAAAVIIILVCAVLFLDWWHSMIAHGYIRQWVLPSPS